jgi:ammonium transporter Rh
MTFLHRYAFGAVGYTFLIGVLCIFWGTLCSALFRQCSQNGCPWSTVQVDLEKLIYGLFGAGAVMISFGGVIGKVTILQLLLMAIMEIPIYALNEAICTNLIDFSDVGGTISIHLFGAYFGLTICMVRRKNGGPNCPDNKPSAEHDIFSLIGTLFLWICWPSFNAALAGELEQLTILNTILSICASCVTTFMLSALINRGRFEMMAVQNASLAGAGACCS